MNCLNSVRTEDKLKSHEKVYKNRDICGIVMPSKKNEKLKFNQYMKSDIMPYIIYVDIESFIKKQMDGQIILKILQQKRWVRILLVDIQCQQFGDLII